MIPHLGQLHWCQRLVRGVVPWTLLLLTLMASAHAGPKPSPDARASKVNFVIEGKVLDVDDGDTLVLRGAAGGRFTIRLSDLDAPETEHARNPYRERRTCRDAPHRAPAQAAGEAAHAALVARAPRKSAARAECYTIDRYGRPVCHVFVAGVNLNLAQLTDGWGMLLDKPAWQRDPASAAAEQAARAARRGIWTAARPEHPDAWRARCWCRGACAVR